MPLVKDVIKELGYDKTSSLLLAYYLYLLSKNGLAKKKIYINFNNLNTLKQQAELHIRGIYAIDPPRSGLSFEDIV